MFYQFMKWYLGWMMKLYFKRVYSKGTEKMPEGHPAIITSNHPAGFAEPIIFTTNVRQSIHFLVLGSYLRSPWLQWFFRGVKMVPIFRRDIAGNQSIEKNKSTFNYVYKALEKDSHILIYPEAKTHFLYKVRTLRKGVVRMAYGFLQKKTHDKMYIVPVGINFIYPSKFRSELFLEVGDPIVFDSIEGDENIWYKRKLDEIKTSMKKVVFDIEDEEKHALAQKIAEIANNNRSDKIEYLVKTYVKDEDHVSYVRNIIKKIDDLPKEAFDTLNQKFLVYKGLLNKYKINDRTVVSHKGYKLIYYLLLVIGLPFFILGMLLNGLCLLAGWYVKKNKVKRIEYKAAVASAIPTVLILIFAIVCLFLGIFIHFGFILLGLLIPITLYLSIFYLDLMVYFIQKMRWSRIKLDQKEELKKIRNDLLSHL